MEAPLEEANEKPSILKGVKELFLTAGAALGALLTVAAIVIVISSTEGDKDQTLKSCKTQICIKEALEILNHIDVGIDPCKNFCAFACNNIPELPMEDGGHNTSTVLLEKELIKIEKLYNEPIKNNEHDLIKLQKKMYKACMNETEITKNALTTIKEILKKLGGWPVVEGANWGETSFDWVETVYKIREFGYDFASFLQVTIVPDPKHEYNNIFEVSIPYINDVYSKSFDSNKTIMFMTDVSVVFGAQAHTAFFEMNETYQFLQELHQKKNELTNYHEMLQKTTIEKLMHRETSINWMEFVNRIVGPRARVYEDDFVLFPPTNHLDQWLGLLHKTPKRTLANYIMWKIVEEVLPYLIEDLDKSGVRPRFLSQIQGKKETRSIFCINEIGKRFIPNPMEIMYIRKYLLTNKRESIDEIIRNMKTEFVNITKEIKWMNSEDKQNAVNRINGMHVMIGIPANYFDDAILDMLLLGGLGNIDDHNFLTLLSQANKNNLDWLYSLINKSTSETKTVWRNLLSNVIEYDVENNEINIPAIMVQDPIFNEKRPNYLNYARLGIALKDIFFEVLVKPYGWSNQSKKALELQKTCLIRDKNFEKTSMFDLMMERLITNILGIKISYGAYNNWAKNNNELPLITLNFTSKQLFWMTSGYLFCENTLGYANLEIQAAEAYKAAVFEVSSNNMDLAQDFNCTKSRVNFKDICTIF